MTKLADEMNVTQEYDVATINRLYEVNKALVEALGAIEKCTKYNNSGRLLKRAEVLPAPQRRAIAHAARTALKLAKEQP